MDKKFDQKKYIKEYNKNNYKQFKAELPKEEKEYIDKFLKENNLSKAEFIRKAYKILKGEFYMYKEEVKKYLEENKIEQKNWFKDVFSLGNYHDQDQDEEETISLRDGSVFIVVDKNHEHAYVSISDENNMEYTDAYLTYAKANKLINKLK